MAYHMSYLIWRHIYITGVNEHNLFKLPALYIFPDFSKYVAMAAPKTVQKLLNIAVGTCAASKFSAMLNCNEHLITLQIIHVKIRSIK